MAVVTQVLLSCLLLAVVYSSPVANNHHRYDHGHLRPRRLLFNPLRFLKVVARLTYPITNGVNNAIGEVGGFNNPPPNNFLGPNGPPRMDGFGYNDGIPPSLLASLLEYFGIYAPDHDFHDSDESKSSEPNSGEDYRSDNDPEYSPALSSNSAEDVDGDNDLEIDEEHDANPTDLLQFTGRTTPDFSSTEKPISVPEELPTDLKSNDDISKREAEFQFEPKTSGASPPTNQDAPSPTVNQPAASSNLPNQGYYVVSPPKRSQPNYFIDGATSGPREGLMNVQNAPVLSNPAIVNGNAPGNVFHPTSSGSQPNVIYAIMNPNNANPTNAGKPTFIPVYVNNGAQTQPGVNPGNVFYIVPDNGGSGLSYNPANGGGIPVTFTPTNGASGGKTPVVFVPAPVGSGSNSPVTFIPANNAPGGNVPVSFIPSNPRPGFDGPTSPGSATNGKPYVVYVLANGGAMGAAPVNYNSGYLVNTKAPADKNSR